jgi:hypothetical protein
MNASRFGRPAPRSADYAADVIAELTRDCRSKKARIRMAEMAISMGNYTDEARTVWRDYLATEVAQ